MKNGTYKKFKDTLKEQVNNDKNLDLKYLDNPEDELYFKVKFTKIYSFGGEGQGDTQGVVYAVKPENESKFFVQICWSYDSWNGSDQSDYWMRQVTPIVKSALVFEEVKDEK